MRKSYHVRCLMALLLMAALFLGIGKTSASAEEGSREKVRAFVSRLYTYVLDREPDEEGLDQWTERLMSGELTGAQAAMGFLDSKEFISKNVTNEEYVEKLYWTFFNRAPDKDGYDTWIKRLRQGFLRKYVLRGFVDSQEFGDLCAEYGIERGKVKLAFSEKKPSDANIYINMESVGNYVDRLYQTVLDREADEEGRKYWTERIASGEETAADVTKRGFFESKEYLERHTTDAEYVTSVYKTMLDREPDEAGLNYWTDQLASGAVTRSQVIEIGFGGSSEFMKILRSYGLAPEKRDDAPVSRTIFVGDSRSLDMFTKNDGKIEGVKFDDITVYVQDAAASRYLRAILNSVGMDGFDTLISWMGANDYGEFDHYRPIYDEVLANGKNLILCTVGPSDDKALRGSDAGAFNWRIIGAFNKDLLAYAEEHDLQVIDLHTYIKNNVGFDDEGVHYDPKPTTKIWQYILQELG